MTAQGLERELAGLLEAGHTAPFEQLPRLLETAAKQAGAGGARLFVADLQEDVLREVTGVGLNAGDGGEECRIEGTLPGRAYQLTELTVVARGGACWVPVRDGTERLGVLRVEPGPGDGGAADEGWCGRWCRWRGCCWSPSGPTATPTPGWSVPGRWGYRRSCNGR
ncbi:hypothetical protein ACN24M_39120 [Streptomyces microflavus]|uniref:hypothetical protein n=1 Tax=Streptomyces microflavus TaxID=1919 RepID=UPI003B21D216